MVHDKTLLANTLSTIISNIEFEDDNNVKTPIDKLLTPQQKYQLLLNLLNNFPKNDFGFVLDFHDKFNVQKEEEPTFVDMFKFAELRLSLILEEAIELGYALTFDKADIYQLFIKVFNKVQAQETDKAIVEIGDALTDLLFVTYGAFDVFNLKKAQYPLMEEVYRSNMSKLISVENNNWLTIVTETVASYKEKGIDVVSENLQNGYIAILNKETRKILKPITYSPPDLTTIILKTK